MIWWQLTCSRLARRRFERGWHWSRGPWLTDRCFWHHHEHHTLGDLHSGNHDEWAKCGEKEADSFACDVLMLPIKIRGGDDRHLNNFLKEVLRKYPVAVFISRLDIISHSLGVNPNFVTEFYLKTWSWMIVSLCRKDSSFWSPTSECAEMKSTSPNQNS